MGWLKKMVKMNKEERRRYDERYEEEMGWLKKMVKINKEENV